MAFIWALSSDGLLWIGATSALSAHMPNVAELPQAALVVAPTTIVCCSTACTGIVKGARRDMATGAMLAVVTEAAKLARITCPMAAAVLVAAGAVCVDRGSSRAAKTRLATLVSAAEIAKHTMSVASACTCASSAISSDRRCWIVQIALDAWTTQRITTAELTNHTVLMVAELVI